MKQVTPEYVESMAQPLRNRSYAEVEFSNIDTRAANDGSWESTDQASWSEMETLDHDSRARTDYATLELHRWVADGSFDILPTNPTQNGYVSNSVADESGVFSTPPLLVRSFDVPHDIPALTLVSNEFPKSITVSFYGGDTLLDEVVVDNITTKTVEVNTLAAGIDRIEVTPTKGLPYYRYRLDRVVYGVIVTFTDDVIVSLAEHHEVDPISRRLPVNEFTLSVYDMSRRYDPENPEGIWAKIDTRSPITVRYGYEVSNGVVEWLKSDRYILNGRPSVNKYLATFSGMGILQALSKDKFYKGSWTNKSFYDLAEEVLLDADLPLTNDGEHPWVIDESLQTMFTTNPLPIETHQNCLQMIAHACRCKLYTDDDNIIHIEPSVFPTETVLALDGDNIFADRQVLTRSDQLRNISVEVFQYGAELETNVITTITTDQTKLHVELDAPTQNTNLYVTGGSIVSQQIYARAIDLELTEGTKSVRIAGRKCTEVKQTYTENVNTDGADDTESNVLISNESMAIALRNHVRDYLLLRNTYDVEYRGNPELEVGDKVVMDTPFTENLPYEVIIDELNYGGTLRGRLKVKCLV